jgi:inhibitor of KinA
VRPVRNFHLPLYIVNLESSFSIFPLGDSAITFDLGNYIEEELNRKALALQGRLNTLRFPAITDIIVAYSSVSVFYDPALLRTDRKECGETAFLCMKHWLEEVFRQMDPLEPEQTGPIPEKGILSAPPPDIVRIPVCYEDEYGPDLERVAEEKGMSREEVVHRHSSALYKIHMIGFLPGFPYMGGIDPRLAISRKPRPVPVLAGGVGIAEQQTGIYPLNSPGGWQIIGRTPWELFIPEKETPVRLHLGDRVLFYPITPVQFRSWEETGW